MNFDIFPLPIFPHGSLRESVVTTVWLGVMVVTFFNMRLGWSLSGLVVPGYLVPLILNKPIAAGVVVFEGIITYFLVYLLSEQLSKFGGWSNFFGRDRFFALFLGSVVVRIFFDGWILPDISQYLVDEMQFRLDYRSDLHSFGTIIVALIANCFWKTGVLRGLAPFSISLAVTYLLTRYVLMELTNFNIGSLFYLYEDIALSFYASPKAYMILIIAALFASRANLLFGWDFNGILLPALLALQWYQPAKIATTLIETAVIVILAHGYLSLPWVREASYQGARKILLFFNMSFLYKFIMGYALVEVAPHTQVTDFYGFGYLLPSLLAIKIYDKHIPIRVAVATIVTSFGAAVVASIIGFMLAIAPNPFHEFAVRKELDHLPPLEETEQSLVSLAQQAKMRAYEKRVRESMISPLPWELERFGELVTNLKKYQQNQAVKTLTTSRALAHTLGYEVLLVQKKYIVLQEDKRNRGWGTYIFRLQSPSTLVIEVPEPIREWNAIESGVILCEELGAAALALGGASLNTNSDRSSNTLAQRNTIMREFHKVMSKHNVLQLRGYTRTTLRQLLGTREQTSDAAVSSLWVRGQLPDGLVLSELKELVGSFDIRWETSPQQNVLREMTGKGFAELWLSREDRKELLFTPLLKQVTVSPQDKQLRIDGYLQEWLLGTKREIAPKGSAAYVVPSLRELIYFDEEVLSPLLHLLRHDFSEQIVTDQSKRELSAINLAANVLGYGVRWYRHSPSGREYIILAEQARGKKRKHWGTYIFRIRPENPFLVQVPRPINDRNSFEIGVGLFEDTDAEALLIAGAHRFANLDGSSDLLYFENRKSIFNLVTQSILRSAEEQPMLVMHSRAYREEAGRMPLSDILLSTSRGVAHENKHSPLLDGLLQELEKNNFSVAFVDGSPETRGYEAGSLVQSRYLEQVRNKELVVMWFSPMLRSAYRQQVDNARQHANFESLGIQTKTVDLYETIRDSSIERKTTINSDVRRLVEHYIKTQDVIALQKLLADWPEFAVTRIIDKNSKQAFLMLSRGEEYFPVIANLNPRAAADRQLILKAAAVPYADVKQYMFSGITWLEPEAG